MKRKISADQVPLSIAISKDLAERIRLEAARRQLSGSRQNHLDVIREVLEREFAKKEE